MHVDLLYAKVPSLSKCWVVGDFCFLLINFLWEALNLKAVFLSESVKFLIKYFFGTLCEYRRLYCFDVGSPRGTR